jgi:hypothetical protein
MGLLRGRQLRSSEGALESLMGLGTWVDAGT